VRLSPVVHFTGQTGYDVPLPYAPPETYPELGFLGSTTAPDNRIYAAVREMLRALGYDARRYGSPQWSPLSDLVGPGGCVVLKPNFVRHYNEDPAGALETVVTHPAVLRPLADYALKAVGPRGSVVIADAPQYDCEVETLLEKIRLRELLRWYREELGAGVQWRDLRVQFGRQENGIVVERRELTGDPLGYEAVDLGSASEFAGLPEPHIGSLRGADYDEEVTIRHHSEGRNEYLVARTILDADLVVNVPKIKTHKKSGVTLSMKNLIGINGDKNWLPHYRAGFRSRGGDEFPRADPYSRFRAVGTEVARRLLKRSLGGAVFRRLRALENASGLGARTRAGNWYGNDTIWRTVLDLNKIVYLGDRCGALGRPSRRVLNVYDGIVAGEGDGPMGPSARPIGLLVAGEDPGAADSVITWLLGFDWRRIPLLARSLQDLGGGCRISGFRGDPTTLPVLWLDEAGQRELRFSDIDLDLRFEAHPGWSGHIERERERVAACAS
jgi:uncharacterized protein (DUF362 family)